MDSRIPQLLVVVALEIFAVLRALAKLGLFPYGLYEFGCEGIRHPRIPVGTFGNGLVEFGCLPDSAATQRNRNAARRYRAIGRRD